MQVLDNRAASRDFAVDLSDTSEKDGSDYNIFNNYIVDHAYYKNEIIYMQEDPADYLYIVVSGYVRLSYMLLDGSSVFLDVISPGGGFGELGVHDGEAHTETATAMGDVCIARIRADVFRNRMLNHAEVQRFLTHLLARRYRWYMHSTCNLSLSSLASRLSQVLLYLCKSLGRSTKIDGHSYPYLPTIITQSDLGAMARGTRGNVNRLLKKWEREGLILLQNRSVVLLRRSKLKAILNEDSW